MVNMTVRALYGSFFKRILGSKKELFFSYPRYIMSRYLGFDFSLFGMSSDLSKLFDSDYKGFFVELGAADGIRQSNTALLEFQKKWSGLLIEPDPPAFYKCFKWRKKSVVLNNFISSKAVSCLANSGGDLQNIGSRYIGARSYATTCPLSSIFDALEIKEIDIISIDVEGAEIDVLSSIDFTKVDIKYILVETDCVDAVTAELPEQFSLIKKLSFHDYLFSSLVR